MCTGEVRSWQGLSEASINDKDRLHYFLSQKIESDVLPRCGSNLFFCPSPVHISAQRQQDVTCDKHTKLELPANVRGVLEQG